MRRNSAPRSHSAGQTGVSPPESSESAFESLQRRLVEVENTDYLARQLSTLGQSDRILEVPTNSFDEQDTREVFDSPAGGCAQSLRQPAPRQPPFVAVSQPPLCRFFVLGKCRYGSHCTYSHALPAEVSECAQSEEEGLNAAAALVDCPFFLRGNCKYGDFCRLRHNTGVAASTSTNSFASSARPTTTTTTVTAGGGAAASGDAGNQQEYTCGICFEDIVESGKHFGLLSCDHCFCLDCLRAWRQSKDMEVEVIRACPACRVPSNYIVPSLTFCTGEAKRQVVAAYKAHLAMRECKYFNGLFGSCPFGPHCFYAHRDSEGRDVKHLDRPKRPVKPQRGSRRGSGGNAGDAVLTSLLQRYSHLFRFLDMGDWDDFVELVGGEDALNNELDDDIDDEDDDDGDYGIVYDDDDYDDDEDYDDDYDLE